MPYIPVSGTQFICGQCRIYTKHNTLSKYAQGINECTCMLEKCLYMFEDFVGRWGLICFFNYTSCMMNNLVPCCKLINQSVIINVIRFMNDLIMRLRVLRNFLINTLALMWFHQEWFMVVWLQKMWTSRLSLKEYYNSLSAIYQKCVIIAVTTAFNLSFVFINFLHFD